MNIKPTGELNGKGEIFQSIRPQPDALAERLATVLDRLIQKIAKRELGKMMAARTNREIVEPDARIHRIDVSNQ